MNAPSHITMPALEMRPAPLIKCAVCHECLYPEDFRPDLFREDAVAALHEKHGVNVCFGCMDDARKTPPVEDEWL
ncbi:hypothetical protein [Yoonia sp.]|uniref:hypothetical protein n=1 Tax=Yoonia sp. TaxID=2212373 RepID=UPI002E090CE7|nr:hypothetical protein [Yoonia sp.]